MDINEKLAARRRELAIEAEERRQAEAVVINGEVAKRLAEKGIVLPVPKAIPATTIDIEVELVLNKAAGSRITDGETAAICILFVGGMLAFFVAWWLGVGLIIWAAVYAHQVTERHKAAIIAEGKAKVAASQSVPTS